MNLRKTNISTTSTVSLVLKKDMVDIIMKVAIRKEEIFTKDTAKEVFMNMSMAKRGTTKREDTTMTTRATTTKVPTKNTGVIMQDTDKKEVKRVTKVGDGKAINYFKKNRINKIIWSDVTLLYLTHLLIYCNKTFLLMWTNFLFIWSPLPLIKFWI